MRILKSLPFLKTLLALMFWVIASSAVFAQNKVVILGSSTAYGIGALPISYSWANLFSSYQQSLSPSTTVLNLAIPGFVTYDILPTGNVPPAGRPSPSVKNNITAALAENPTVIIISLTSNDAANNYSLAETQNNLIRLVDIAKAAGVRTYVTTTAPRNLSSEQRNLQLLTRDWITSYFGIYSIDFWSSLSNVDGTVRSEVLYEDNIHFNNRGHNILYERVKSKDIFNLNVLAVKFKEVSASLKQDGSIQIEWTMTVDNSIETFEIEKSIDQVEFKNIGNLSLRGGNVINKSYSWLDKDINTNNIFYRIVAVSKSGAKTFSQIVLVKNEKILKQISVYPNPIDSDVINIKYRNIQEGKYLITVSSQNGQLQSQEYKFLEKTGSITLHFRQKSSGSYKLQVKGKDTTFSKVIVVK